MESWKHTMIFMGSNCKNVSWGVRISRGIEDHHTCNCKIKFLETFSADKYGGITKWLKLLPSEPLWEGKKCTCTRVQVMARFLWYTEVWIATLWQAMVHLHGCTNLHVRRWWACDLITWILSILSNRWYDLNKTLYELSLYVLWYFWMIVLDNWNTFIPLPKKENTRPLGPKNESGKTFLGALLKWIDSEKFRTHDHLCVLLGCEMNGTLTDLREST